MRKFFSFGRKADAPHPLLDLLAFAASVPPAPRDSPETAERLNFDALGVPEKKILSKLLTDGDYINQFRPAFDPAVLVSLLDYLGGAPTQSDRCTIIVLFHGLVLLESPAAQTLDNWLLCQRSLNLIINWHLPTVRNHLFAGLLAKLETAKEVTFDLVCAILEHFRLNLTLEPRVFGGFCWAARLLLMRDEQAATDRLFDVIFELVDTSAPVIDLNDIGELIAILQPSINELNVTVLTILSKLSSKGVKLLDPFCLIISQLERYVAPKNSQLGFVVRKPPHQLSHYSVAMPLRFITTEFRGVFWRLPFDELEQTLSIWKLISQRGRDALQCVSGFFHMLPADGKREFVHVCQPFVESMDRDVNFFIYLASFLAIFQDLDRDLLGLILPSIFRTVAFSDSDTIFDDTGIGIETNTLRSGVFHLIIRFSPEFVVIGLNEFAERPFLFTECLVRILATPAAFQLRELLYESGPLQLLLNCSVVLQQMPPSERLFRCRSALFVFLHEMATRHRFLSRLHSRVASCGSSSRRT
jgi:hypothetical protein